jgi:hypothetical protein
MRINNNYNPKTYTNTSLGVIDQKTEIKGPSGTPTLNKDQDVTDNVNTLNLWQDYYFALSGMRENAERFERYKNGDQWGDVIKNQDGKLVKEEDHIRAQGKIPLKNNRIAPLIDTVKGAYLQNPSDSIILSYTREKQKESEVLQNVLQSVRDFNLADLIEADLLEQFLTQKVIVGKTGYKYHFERSRFEGYMKSIPFSNMFFNTDITDPRVEPDLTVIGEIVDTTLDRLISEFAVNRADEEIIREWYSNQMLQDVIENRLETDHAYEKSFWEIPPNNKVRIYIGWELKAGWRIITTDPTDLHNPIEEYDYSKELEDRIVAINEERIQMAIDAGHNETDAPVIRYRVKREQFWTYKYITPSGHTLAEGETPYSHGSHPYSLMISRRGFVENIIDQQRYINRLIILIDFMLGAGAKGVLMIPEDMKPDGMSEKEFADEYVKFNGVIFYKPSKKNPNAKPQQIYSQSTNIGAFELLNMQLSLMQEISGVSKAAQGQNADAGTPASRYAMEAQNSATNMVGVIHQFRSFKKSMDSKLLKTCIQNYEEERILGVSGNSAIDESMVYKPGLIDDLDFDVKVTEGTSTPVFRQLLDEQLMILLDKGVIDGKMYLKNTSLPFADKLLEQIENATANGDSLSKSPEALNEIQAMAQENSDPRANELIQQMLSA